MVRRRKPSGATGKDKNNKPRGADRKDAKIKAWNKPEDIPQDDQDLCMLISFIALDIPLILVHIIVFAGRDKILLDGTDVGRNHDIDEYDNEEEVFTLKGLDGGDDDEEEDFDEDEDQSSEEEDDDDAAEETTPTTKQSKKTASKAAKAKAAAADDESGSDSDEEERWGKNKSAYYSSTAKDAIESDDEETRAMEEAEARRLQAKARELVKEDDFGFEDLPVVTESPSYVHVFISNSNVLE